MKHKQLKYALFRSLTALILCLVMLLGTTYAWQTDTLTTPHNILMSGTLDVELQYAKIDGSITDIENVDWLPVGPDDVLFKEVGWVPSDMDVVYLRVVNKGELDAKYRLELNVFDEVEGTNIANEPYWLSENINGKVIDSKTLELMHIDNIANFRPHLEGTTLEESELAVPLKDIDVETLDGQRTGVVVETVGLHLLDDGVLKASNDSSEITASEPIAVLLGMPSTTSEANYKESDDVKNQFKYLSTFKLGITLVATQEIGDEFEVDMPEDSGNTDGTGKPDNAGN